MSYLSTLSFMAQYLMMISSFGFSPDEAVRLAPRHKVLSFLAAEGLRKRCTLFTACNCTEKRFLEKFVEPYKKDVPELSDAYFASRS
ncbi:hypothetical protein FCM35_KLT05577 [Carex littledalei]|uniref:Uncharacterized protein n=1 Tax=Carex littledalei TaxID=544730 RepID=A0A833VM73_9POAL|nr:hypothetical protein FCM35_KLT05577 [Carex littledalei]